MDFSNCLGELDIVLDAKDGCDRIRVQRNEGTKVERASDANKFYVRLAACCRGPVDDW